MKFVREALRKSTVLYQSFFSEIGLENYREIGRFFREFVSENPAKFDFFFPRPTRSPAVIDGQMPWTLDWVIWVQTMAGSFLLCSIISLLVKYDFILRYEAWVNAIRASSFIENFPQISAKPIAFQRNNSHEISRSSIIFQRNWPRKFPQNPPLFREFVPENPAKFDFFPTAYQKPCTNKQTNKQTAKRIP